jgi:hypothetical protein
MQRRVLTLKLTDVSEVRTASNIRAMMMEAVRTSEMSVNFNVTTRRYIPEDSKRLQALLAGLISGICRSGHTNKRKKATHIDAESDDRDTKKTVTLCEHCQNILLSGN